MTQQLNELDIAQLNERLNRLGLDPGFGRTVQARMMRVSRKIEQLQKLVNPEQMQLLAGMMRQHRGDIEPVVDGLIEEAQSGLLFESKPEQPETKLQPFTNRKMRRKKRRAT